MSQDESADVIVVGAGPAGCSAAAHLARAGQHVLVLGKGDRTTAADAEVGSILTPRAVRELATLGIATDGPDWVRTKGVRFIGGGMRMQVAWPSGAQFPDHGLNHRGLAALLGRHAAAQGADIRPGVEVTAPLIDAAGRVIGVQTADASLRAPVVIAADGGDSPLAAALGRRRRAGRPARTVLTSTYACARASDDHLEIWTQVPGAAGHGWVAALGDGTSQVGLVLHDGARPIEVLAEWTASMPPEWRIDDSTRVGDVRRDELPVGLGRRPLYADGLMLVGDAAGTANPICGEGIAAALESGRLAAAAIVEALGRDAAGREQALAGYSTALRGSLGGYYTMGRWFAKMIGNPHLARIGVRYGLPRQTTMRFMLKAAANLGATRGGDAQDRLLATLARVTPAA